MTETRDTARHLAARFALRRRNDMRAVCRREAGAQGEALADALCDMLTDGSYPFGWPLAEAASMLTAAAEQGNKRARLLRAELIELRALVVAEDEPERDIAA